MRSRAPSEVYNTPPVVEWLLLHQVHTIEDDLDPTTAVDELTQ